MQLIPFNLTFCVFTVVANAGVYIGLQKLASGYRLSCRWVFRQITDNDQEQIPETNFRTIPVRKHKTQGLKYCSFLTS